ncbi:hypothetical protein ACTXT7_011499 [Hymenolepis weldensis]
MLEDQNTASNNCQAVRSGVSLHIDRYDLPVNGAREFMQMESISAISFKYGGVDVAVKKATPICKELPKTKNPLRLNE